MGRGGVEILVDELTKQIDTAFSLPLNQFSGVMPPLSSDVANSLRNKLKNLKILAIDEVSMISTTSFGQIYQRCKDIFRNKQPFGGLNVFLSGQLWQLPPIGTRIFLTDPKDVYGYIAGPILWRLFEYYELTQIFAIALGKLGRGEKLTDEEFKSFVECEQLLHLIIQNTYLKLIEKSITIMIKKCKL